MDLEKFEKQYAYNVRHIYGKEGKRQDKLAYNCMKIITSNQPGPGDYHGCPFKHSDADILQRRLLSYNTPKDATREIIELVKKQHFQVACARYFEVTHKLPEGSMNLNHPNEYFSESRKILKGGPQARVNAASSVKGKTEVKEEPMNDSSLTNTSALTNTSTFTDSSLQNNSVTNDTTLEEMEDFDMSNMDDDIQII